MTEEELENKQQNDMASFLRIPVPCFMLPLYKERKVNIAFVPFNSEWKKELLLSEKPTGDGGMEYIFKQYDFVQIYNEDNPSMQVTRKFQAFSLDRCGTPEEKKKTLSVGNNFNRVVIYFR